MKLRKPRKDSILPTAYGLNCRKLFKSLQRLHNFYFHHRELFLYSVMLIKAGNVEYCCLNPNCKLLSLLLLLLLLLLLRDIQSFLQLNHLMFFFQCLMKGRLDDSYNIISNFS